MLAVTKLIWKDINRKSVFCILKHWYQTSKQSGKRSLVHPTTAPWAMLWLRSPVPDLHQNTWCARAYSKGRAWARKPPLISRFAPISWAKTTLKPKKYGGKVFPAQGVSDTQEAAGILMQGGTFLGPCWLSAFIKFQRVPTLKIRIIWSPFSCTRTRCYPSRDGVLIMCMTPWSNFLHRSVLPS